MLKAIFLCKSGVNTLEPARPEEAFLGLGQARQILAAARACLDVERRPTAKSKADASFATVRKKAADLMQAGLVTDTL